MDAAGSTDAKEYMGRDGVHKKSSVVEKVKKANCPHPHAETRKLEPKRRVNTRKT